MALSQCPKHKKFVGLRAPKRSKLNPDGCPTCWEIYRERQVELHKEAEAPKRKKHTDLSRGNLVRSMDGLKKLRADRLKIEVDDMSGEYAIVYGTRCMFTAVNMDEVDSFLAGLREGLRHVENRDDES